MARNRVRAAARKRNVDQAHLIGSGVYAIARDLLGQPMALPLHVTAPLIYVCEMLAGVICEREPVLRDRQDDVSRYLMGGLQEFTVAMFERFDQEHFEAWIAAAITRDG